MVSLLFPARLPASFSLIRFPRRVAPGVNFDWPDLGLPRGMWMAMAGVTCIFAVWRGAIGSIGTLRAGGSKISPNKPEYGAPANSRPGQCWPMWTETAAL